MTSFIAFGQPATKVVITTQPVAGIGQGTLMPVQPVVEIRDAANQKVTTSTAQVEIVIASGTGGTIGGTTRINAVNGVATFTNLTFSGLQNQSYTFQFNSVPVIASEPFAYSSGTLPGNNGGTGWSGAWFGANPAFTDLSVNITGFTYTNFSTSGGRATYTSGTGGDAGRQLPSVSNAVYSVVWLAFLANYDLQGGGFNNLRLYLPGSVLSGAVGGNGGVSNWAILDNTLGATTFTSFPLNGTLHLALLKIDYSAGSSSLWIDPVVASFDGTQTPSITQSFAPVFDRIDLYNRTSGIGTDEITLASTYKAALHLEQNLASDISTAVTLPVKWNYFTASCEDTYTLLKWGTTDEQGNSHFVVERRTGALEWSPIGRIDGTGNNGSDQQYQFRDSAFSSMFYYRLRQVDFNGNTSLSKIVTANCQTGTEGMFRVFPNPASGMLRLTGVQPGCLYELVNAGGHSVRKGQIRGNGIISLSGLPEGIYFLTIAGYPSRTVQVMKSGR